MWIVSYLYRYKFIAISLVLVFALRGFGLPLDFVQTIVFPVFLLAFWLAFGRRGGFSFYLILLPMLIWAFGALHLRGYIVLPISFPGPYVAHLEGDKDNQKAIVLYQRFNEIARAYKLNELHFVHRKFETSANARAWLSRKSDTSFLISGNPDWLDIILRPQLKDYFYLDGAEVSEFDYALPNYFPIASEHSELTLHFLAWFSEGLQSGAEDELSLSQRNDALLVAASSVGPWKSLLPLAMAQTILGSRYSMENRDESALANCAQRAFERAASYVSRKNDAEAFAAIFNNAAVNKLRYARSEEDIKLAEHLLWRALGAKDKNGVFPPSVRVAYRNLELMHKRGLL